MSEHAIAIQKRLGKPVLEQSPDLEKKIRKILNAALPHTGGWFHLQRYLIWPTYLMPVYYYKVHGFEIVLERHSSYWKIIFTSSDVTFHMWPFLKRSSRRDAFVGLECEHVQRYDDIKTRRLERHVDTESELMYVVRMTIPLMKELSETRNRP
jgi:hypothetical protein